MRVDELFLQRQLQQELIRTQQKQEPNIPQFFGELKGIEFKTEKEPSFIDTLKQMIQEVNQLQQESKQKQEDFIKGEPVEIHDVMIAAEKAKTSFQLLMEIRNKFLDFYREIIRLQI
ncbi:MAG: flagellar hook-basal body complex protein FliE [Ignavibacteria bacterium]|nr:flagellar hook-basal body complex protein FliE [Ignavibacteria bacterium]